MNDSKKSNYYSGGMAELIASPSPLTYSFLKDWFTGSGSVGIAMKNIGLPYRKLSLPLVELVSDELLVNIANEEKTLYADTIFHYKNQPDMHEQPNLAVSFSKLFHPLSIANTVKTILVQSKWIANPQAVIQTAQQYVTAIPTLPDNGSLAILDETLKTAVWPNVIAVGLISEFFHQFVTKEAANNVSIISVYMSSEIAKKDWFFCSVADQAKVQKGEMTFAEYLSLYGMRGDKDYELSCPRWHEIPDVISERIKKFSHEKTNEPNHIELPKRLRASITAATTLQILRSEAKRKALPHINALRRAILDATKNIQDIQLLTKEAILSGHINTSVVQSNNPISRKKDIPAASSGKGTSVSQGMAAGIVKHITDNESDISKGTIGIFPNASPEFANQYPKCAGMVFLKGGQTSHGAIVAREFGIPAIIDRSAEGTIDGQHMEMNGVTGEWKII